MHNKNKKLWHKYKYPFKCGPNHVTYASISSWHVIGDVFDAGVLSGIFAVVQSSPGVSFWQTGLILHDFLRFFHSQIIHIPAQSVNRACVYAAVVMFNLRVAVNREMVAVDLTQTQRQDDGGQKDGCVCKYRCCNVIFYSIHDDGSCLLKHAYLCKAQCLSLSRWASSAGGETGWNLLIPHRGLNKSSVI